MSWLHANNKPKSPSSRFDHRISFCRLKTKETNKKKPSSQGFCCHFQFVFLITSLCHVSTAIPNTYHRMHNLLVLVESVDLSPLRPNHHHHHPVIYAKHAVVSLV